MTITTDKRHMVISEISRKYRYYAIVKIYNKRVVIVSNTRFNLQCQGVLGIAERYKVPTHRVIINMQMGKPYTLTDTRVKTTHYRVINSEEVGVAEPLQIYTVVSL